MLTLDKIYQAQYVLKQITRTTDVINAHALSQDADCDIFLKLENLQRTGSFKVRGAFFKISQLSDEEKKRGVIACSAGNHAQGVAIASKKFGVSAKICMPDGAPISKVMATRGYGAEVILVPGVYDDAHNEAERLKEEFGYTLIHPFDDEDVIAGQGTVGIEILQQMKEVDAIVVPVGGGGLLAGIAYAVKSLNPNIRVYGVQAAGAASMVNSFNSGKIQNLASVSTIADGIAVKEPGALTYEIISKYADGLVTVTDDQISAAILALIEKQKTVAEGAGAVALAAVMFKKIPDIKGKKVCCLISGGNIDVTILSRVINRGLLMSGRSCSFTLELMDRPGQLTDVTSIIAKCGGNIISAVHERSSEGSAVNCCILRLNLETKNFEHIEQIKNELKSNGFKIL